MKWSLDESMLISMLLTGPTWRADIFPFVCYSLCAWKPSSDFLLEDSIPNAMVFWSDVLDVDG